MSRDRKVLPSERSVTDQAAAWFARRRTGPWSEVETASFAAWLRADPSHPAAWSSFERLWGHLDNVRDEPEILRIRERARRSAARHQTLVRSARVGGALAAGVVVGVIAWSIAREWAMPLLRSPVAQGTRGAVSAATLVRDVSTDIGERRVLALSDGSKITLNTASAVHSDYGSHERQVMLVRGEAFFDVAKDPARPFVVTAGSRRVIALGTAFNVRLREHNQVTVTLVEGKVQVIRSGASGAVPTLAHRTPAINLEPGSALVAREDDADQIQRLDTARATSWRSGKLVFDGERLAEVVAEMNRYSRETLEITDPALEGRRVSGVFEAGSGLGFAKALEDYGIARVSRQTATTIVLASPR